MIEWYMSNNKKKTIQYPKVMSSLKGEEHL